MVAELHHYAELVTYLRSSPHPHKELVLPLYLDGGKFVNPYCCYGNDVDCDLCGAWVVFHLAAKIEEAGKFGSEFRGRLT